MERRSKPEAEYTGRPRGDGAGRSEGGAAYSSTAGLACGWIKAESSACVRDRRG